MFDWDQDVEALTAPAPNRVAALAGLAPTPVARRRLLPRLDGLRRLTWARLAVPAVIAGLLATGGSMHPGVSAAAQGAMAAWLPRAEVTMPATLRAYDQSQFQAFRQGIVGFSDAELLDYERVTLNSHAATGPLLADFTHDALVLTHQEIERRGLMRPVSSLRLGAAFAPRQSASTL